MTVRVVRSVVAVAAAVGMCAAGVLVSAQQILRGGINVVVVDVRVLSKNNQVADLQSDEVTLLVDGRPRPIVSFAYNPAGQSRRPPTAAGTTPPLSDSTPRVVLLIDRDSMAPNDRQPVRGSAQRFLERLPKSFLVAVAPLPLSRSVRFERDRRLAQQALAEAFAGGFQRSLEMGDIAGFGCTGGTATCGTDLSVPSREQKKARADNAATQLEHEQGAVLRDLRWLFTVLASSNEPTDVVIVNGGLPNIDRMRPELERVVGAARVGRVRVHTLRVFNLTRVTPVEDPSAEIDREGADLPLAVPAPPKSFDLAARTGGLEVDRAATGKEFFKYLEEELAGSYLLGFEPLATERDGKLHRVEIRIPGRSKLTIRARKEFVVGPGVDAPTSPAAAEPATTVDRSPAQTAVLPLNPVGGGLQGLIERASDYVDRFERSFAMVVAEERYVQVVKPWMGAPPAAGDEPALRWDTRTDRAHTSRGGDVLRRRQLLSDLLLVQAPGQTWIGYRDVEEVDGKAIRDRAMRIQQLFLSKRAQDRKQLQRIANESARQNLGTFRNINTPTFPLLVLRRSNVARFSLTQYPDDRQDDACCVVIGFSEMARPTIVMTNHGRDLPMAGQLWIEERTGRIRRATLEFDGHEAQVRGMSDVRFRAEPSLDVLVPDRMWEWFMTKHPDAPGRQAYVEGQATYTNLRKFTVSTDEHVK